MPICSNSIRGRDTTFKVGGADFFLVQVTWARCRSGICHLPYIVQKLKKNALQKLKKMLPLNGLDYLHFLEINTNSLATEINSYKSVNSSALVE